MRIAIIGFVLLAGCATEMTPERLRQMPIAEVCYLGLSDQSQRAMAMDEVKRRNDACENHKDEIAQIYASERRATGMGMGSGGTGMPSMGGGGMMGRGY
jgi:hypothetical protein